MKQLNVLLLTALLGLTACELPDVEGMNKMPKQTEEMGQDMKVTNENMRKLKMKEALDELNKEENQKEILPIPTGLMPWGQLFGETATANEIVKLTYLWLRGIEEILPINGLTADDDMTELTEADLAKIRVKKKARLYSLMIIAGYAQDEKVNEIIRTEIQGHGRFQKTAFQFLALRAYFLREIMLKTSLKVASDSDGLLDNSGMMNEAISNLIKLDYISKLPFANLVSITLSEKYFNLLKFEEHQNAEGRKKTADMWNLALEKSLQGQQTYQAQTAVQVDSLGGGRDQEIARQNQAIKLMQSYSKSWEGKLN